MWEDRQTELRSCYLAGPTWAGGADLPVKARPRPVVASCAETSLWFKALGSWTNRDKDGLFLANNQQFHVDLGYDQNTFGFIGGIEGGVHRLFNPADAISFGIMGGFLDSNVDFNTRNTGLKYTGGTVGVSGTYMLGGFFVDALVKADFLNLSFNIPDFIGAGLPALPDADARTIGGMGNIGYRWDIGRFFIEPVATVAYAKTTIDSLATLNQFGADVRFGKGDSLRIAGGSRFGIVLPYGPARRVEASITLRAWDELLGDNNAVILAGPANGNDITLNDGFKKSFGEIKGGIDVLTAMPGWSGFVNAGVKFNDEQQTVTAKGGLTYKWDWMR
jgi:hypothetical protein